MRTYLLARFLLVFIIFQSLALHAYENDNHLLPEGYAEASNTMDAQTEKLLFRFNESSRAFRKIPLEELERIAKEQCSNATPHPNLEAIKNIFIEGANGPLCLRIYKTKSEERLPVFVFFHGGGWTSGSLNHYDYFCQEICDQAKCLIVSVDYRQAPRYTYPQPLEDCFFAIGWVEKHIGDHGGDVERIAVGGDSAGGNLAAAVTLKARANRHPRLLCQVLICPVLNYNFDTLSYFEFSEGFLLSREDMKFFWDLYLGDIQTKKDPLISPLQADSLRGLPSAFLVIANLDPLRDEGLAYGLRLYREGVRTCIKRFDSIHGFYCFQELDMSKKAIDSIAAYLAEEFSKHRKNQQVLKTYLKSL